MKKLLFGLGALVALGPAVFAGETYRYSSKDTHAVVPECPQWYADNEFNLSLSGVYAMTANSWREDTYLGVDHAWGAASTRSISSTATSVSARRGRSSP